MPDIVVIVDYTCLRIDGEVPPGYRLVVHNHTGDVDFYPHTLALRHCSLDPEEYDYDDDSGDPCYLYVEGSTIKYPRP